MSSDTNGPQEQDLDQRLDEQREAGEVFRPLQVGATEDARASVDEERRAVHGEAEDRTDP